MFKLGLLHEAKADFLMLSAIYPKEPMVHFNLGLIYFQLGDYEKSCEPLEFVTKMSLGALNQF